MSRLLPRYPVYVVSKGRHFRPLTAKFLKRDGVPFYIVVEPQERDAYVEAMAKLGVEADRVLVLPFSNLGKGSIPARNWIWEHAKASGAFRHWILDDNIRDILRLYKGQRVVCRAGPAMLALEDFTDRFENVAIAGMNYKMFGFPRHPVFFLNVHVYSCILIRNDLPLRWRGRYNEDTDLCLQALSAGWCTILTNVFLADKLPTLQMKGGNMDQLYQGDGRLKMARDLERAWPGVVRVTRRFGRPQHMIDWRKFSTPLQPKPEWAGAYGPQPTGLLAEVTPPSTQTPGEDEYGLELALRAPREKLDQEIGRYFDDYQNERGR